MRKIKEPHYYRWKAMRERCNKPANHAYARYGGRGIDVCYEWEDFYCFQAWCFKTFEPGKTLDRIDNDKGYSPENCRWATRSEQQLNSRQTEKRKKSNLKLLKRAQVELQKRQHEKYGNPETRTKKKCSICSVVKDLNLFAKARANKDGHAGYCKNCYNAKYWPRTGKEKLCLYAG